MQTLYSIQFVSPLMYSLYSVLVLVRRRGRLAVVPLPGDPLQEIRRQPRQRMGYLPVSFNMDADESIWIHAVSVGEVLTARPLISDLKRRYPDLRMFLSTTTMAGQQLARRSVPDVDAVFYFPFDLGIFVRRTLDLVRPRLFVMMETEIWPNLLRECRAAASRPRSSTAGCRRARFRATGWCAPFMRRVLDDIDRFCVQSEESARRFIDLGADPARVVVTGSLKFDSLDLSSTALQARARDRVLRYFRVPSSRPVIVAGSTMKGEEAAVLRAFRRVRADGAERRCWCWRRAIPSASARSSSWSRRKAGRRRGDRTRHRRRAARRRRRARHHRRAGDDLSDRDRGVRRRQPRRHRRPQHARAGGVRQADRVRPAHGELRRDRRGLRRQRRRRAAVGRAASSTRRFCR